MNIRKKGLHNYRKKNMSLVFQNYNLIDYLTPEENVMLGGKKDIEKILEAVGIPREDWKLTVIRRTAAASGYCKSISKSCEGIACR